MQGFTWGPPSCSKQKGMGFQESCCPVRALTLQGPHWLQPHKGQGFEADGFVLGWRPVHSPQRTEYLCLMRAACTLTPISPAALPGSGRGNLRAGGCGAPTSEWPTNWRLICPPRFAIDQTRVRILIFPLFAL